MTTLFDLTGKVAIVTGSTKGIGKAEEIAGAVVYLVSKASAFMTGQAMVIDGGVTI